MGWGCYGENEGEGKTEAGTVVVAVVGVGVGDGVGGGGGGEEMRIGQSDERRGRCLSWGNTDSGNCSHHFSFE